MKREDAMYSVLCVQCVQHETKGQNNISVYFNNRIKHKRLFFT